MLPICILFFYFSSCNFTKVNHFCIVLHCLLFTLCSYLIILILLHVITSFLHTRSLLVPFSYISIQSIDWILLSLLALIAILLTSSVNTLCFSLLNLCCDFNIYLSLFMSSLWFPLELYTSFLLFSSWFIF